MPETITILASTSEAKLGKRFARFSKYVRTARPLAFTSSGQIFREAYMLRRYSPPTSYSE